MQVLPLSSELLRGCNPFLVICCLLKLYSVHSLWDFRLRTEPRRTSNLKVTTKRLTISFPTSLQPLKIFHTSNPGHHHPMLLPKQHQNLPEGTRANLPCSSQIRHSIVRDKHSGPSEPHHATDYHQSFKKGQAEQPNELAFEHSMACCA
jgi:hypothetical protein